MHVNVLRLMFIVIRRRQKLLVRIHKIWKSAETPKICNANDATTVKVRSKTIENADYFAQL